jgi:hypothetical protein
MFPGPGAQVYYNEAGEPLGWDYPSYDEPENDPYDDIDDYFDDDEREAIFGNKDRHNDGEDEEEEPWTDEDWAATKADEQLHYERENPRG